METALILPWQTIQVEAIRHLLILRIDIKRVPEKGSLRCSLDSKILTITRVNGLSLNHLVCHPSHSY